jgi:hypothetical protein
MISFCPAPLPSQLNAILVRRTAMAITDISDIYGVFDSIRARPGMWVPDKSLGTIELMTHAYGVALSVHNVTEPGLDFNQRFRNYLYRRFRWSMSCGWARAITERSTNPDVAFDRFFNLLNQFRRFEARAASTSQRPRTKKRPRRTAG